MHTRNQLLTYEARNIVAMLNGDLYIATGGFETVPIDTSVQVAVLTGANGCLYDSLSISGEVSELEITMYEGATISGGYEVLSMNLNRNKADKQRLTSIYGGFTIDSPGDVIYSGTAVGSSAWPGGLYAGLESPFLLLPSTIYILDVKNVSVNGLQGTLSLSNLFTDDTETVFKRDD